MSELCCVSINKSIPFEIAALLGCAVTTGVGAVLRPVFGTIPEAKAPTKLVKVIDCIGKL